MLRNDCRFFCLDRLPGNDFTKEGNIASSDMLKCIQISLQHHTPTNSPVGAAKNWPTNHELFSMCINVKALGNSVCAQR